MKPVSSRFLLDWRIDSFLGGRKSTGFESVTNRFNHLSCMQIKASHDEAVRVITAQQGAVQLQVRALQLSDDDAEDATYPFMDDVDS